MKETHKKTLTKLLALGLLLGGTGAVAVSQASADAVSLDNFHPPQMHMGPDFMQKVTRTVEKIDNGVVITLTTDDADTLTKLQDFESADKHHGPLQDMQNVTRTIVQLDNGVQITLTSDDAATVQKLQHGPRGGVHHPGQLPNVTRSVEKIDNGIVITLTSDDPDTVTKLQEEIQQ